MTQSAISHQIRTLEDYIGQPLFKRVKRRVVLSDAGHDLLLSVEEVLRGLDDGFRRLNQYKKPHQLIVHTSSAFASSWLVERLCEFRTGNPDLDVWLYTTDGEPDLDLTEVHVAILFGDGRWKGLSVSKLLSEEYVPMCSPEHAAAKGGIGQPSDLLNHTLLHSELREDWATWFAHVGMPHINPVQGPNFTNPAILLQAAKLGQGVVLGSVLLAAKDMQEGRLVCPLNLRLKSRNGYYIVARHEEEERPKARLFVDWLKSQAENMSLDASVVERQTTSHVDPRGRSRKKRV